MNKILIAFAGCAMLATVACTDKKSELNSKISTMEESLYKSQAAMPDSAAAVGIIELYEDYAGSFPDDTISASYLFKAGDIASKTGNIQKAIMLFEHLVTKYPRHQNAPYALFLQGFIYENQAGDPMKAKPYYEKFLQLYPDHPIAADVSFSLENLGKTPEELIQQFEENNSDSTLAVEPDQPN